MLFAHYGLILRGRKFVIIAVFILTKRPFRVFRNKIYAIFHNYDNNKYEYSSFFKIFNDVKITYDFGIGNNTVQFLFYKKYIIIYIYI